MEPKYLHLTEESNALDYLEKAVSFIKQTTTSDIAWKWVILSLHGALYGFAISACRGTNSDSVIKPTRTKSGTPPRQQLISFDEALKRCCKKSGCVTNPLRLSGQEEKSISFLKQFLRNKFEHYVPCHWSIGLAGFPNMAIDCLHVVRTLATETSMWVHLDPEDRKRITTLTAEADGILLNSPLWLGK
jgi:hypothetical protein